MRLPDQLTQLFDINWILIIGCLAIALYCVHQLDLARDGPMRFVLDVAKAVLLFVPVSMLLYATGKLSPTQAESFAALVSFLFFIRLHDARANRYTPAGLRRGARRR